MRPARTATASKVRCSCSVRRSTLAALLCVVVQCVCSPRDCHLIILQRMQRLEDTSTDNRIKRGKDEDRFYCPYPGCTRSFAELWRLKVHYRAPPDVRGSGKERGHGTELQFCPKCGKELKPGKHHVGCFAGRVGSRQAVKRAREEVCRCTRYCMPRFLHASPNLVCRDVAVFLVALLYFLQHCRSWPPK